MTKTALAVLLALPVTPAPAQVKDCAELKAEIDTKITNNGVTMFTTTIVDMDAPEDGKVVGTCAGQTKKIVYKRGGMPLGEGAAGAPSGGAAASTSKQ